MVTTRSRADKADVEAAYEQATSATSTTTTVDQKLERNQQQQPMDSLTNNVAVLSVAQTAIDTATTLPDIPIFQGEQPPPAEEEEIFEPITTVPEFCALIDATPVDQWQKRTAALDSIVVALSSLLFQKPPDNPELQQIPLMAPAVSLLLKDLRSTVVKRTCASLKNLFQPPHAPHSNNDTSSGTVQLALLWKDIFPTVLDISALTSGLIRKQVQDLVVCVMPLPVCWCPSIVPMILDRLADPKVNKSKTVREACVLYLRLVVEHYWNTASAAAEGDVLVQQTAVGNQLIAAMRDSAPPVRDQARLGLEAFRKHHADVWKQLVTDSNSADSGRDLKLQTLLMKSIEHPTVSLEKLSKHPSSSSSARSQTKKAVGGGPSKFSKFRDFQNNNKANNASAANDDVMVL